MTGSSACCLAVGGHSMTDFTTMYINSRDTVRAAMQCISRAGMNGLPSGIGLVVSDRHILQGIVTDGDIRRGLLAGITLDDPVAKIMTRDPIVFSARMSHQQILADIPKRIAEKGRCRGGVIEKVIIVNDEGAVEQVFDFLRLWRNQMALHRQVTVIGMGYVGLTLAASMAEAGFQVTGVEAEDSVRDSLLAGNPHFHEIGLEALFRHHLGRNLQIAAAPPGAAEIYIIAVGTPIREDHSPALEQLKAAAEQVGKVLNHGDLVVLRSTCPVGTSRNVVLPILEKTSDMQCGRDFYLAFAPERTVEGKALSELRTLPQIIGGFDRNSLDMATSLFRELTTQIITVHSLEAAEMVKLVNNAFRDVTFAFANELAMVCESYNLNVSEVVRAANEGYPRNQVPVASPGVGGPCLRKDPYIFVEAAQMAGIRHSLSLHGREINESMPALVLQKVLRHLAQLGKKPEQSVFFLIGFAFKGEPETSDMRQSTTLDLLKMLKPLAGEIRGHDPVIPAAEVEELGVKACGVADGFAGADCAIIMNNHRSYAQIDIYACLKRMNRPSLYYDCWNIFSPEDVKQIEGITYLGMGFSA